MKAKVFYISLSLLLMILGVGLGILVAKESYEVRGMTQVYLFSYGNVADLIKISNAIENGDINKAQQAINLSLQGYHTAFKKCFDKGELCEDSSNDLSFVATAIKRIEDHQKKFQ